jgi:NAD(P)-dependent dehydrogenase (short-subunit alcohol dehydrogenase family)
VRLSGKNAIVTGAGSGIGRAVALGFASEGAGVVVADVDPARARETALAIEEAGWLALAVQVDVSSKASVDALLGSALFRFDRIDILFNNAGVSSRAPFLEMTEEEWDRVLGVNLKGQFLVGQAIARHMVERGGGGSIINTSSQLAEGAANPRSAHYLASKGGSRMLTRGMAVDLAPHSIRVNALAPGVTVTNLTRQRLDDDAEWRRIALERIPMGRFGEPDDLVGACIFMASDESRYMTGATMVVDGGYTAR